MFYPTSMPLLTGLALFGAVGANWAFPSLLAVLSRPGRKARPRFGAADVFMAVVLGTILGLSVWILVNRALGHLDGTAAPRSAPVAASAVGNVR